MFAMYLDKDRLVPDGYEDMEDDVPHDNVNIMAEKGFRIPMSPNVIF